GDVVYHILGRAPLTGDNDHVVFCAKISSTHLFLKDQLVRRFGLIKSIAYPADVLGAPPCAVNCDAGCRRLVHADAGPIRQTDSRKAERDHGGLQPWVGSAIDDKRARRNLAIVRLEWLPGGR